jgi:hypothetical protein
MSYQGARARPESSEGRRFFAVSKVRLGASGEVTAVLWGEINAKSNLDVGRPVVVPVGDVIDAIHDGAHVSAVFPARPGSLPDQRIEVVEHPDGIETIGLVKSTEVDSDRLAAWTDLGRLGL